MLGSLKNMTKNEKNIAKVGDRISFDIKIHHTKLKSKIVKAKVLQIYENCVLVDVSRIKVYENELTVVNHKN